MNIEEIKQFIENHKDNYSIQLKRNHKQLYDEINSKYNFIKFGEKLYHYLNGDDVGKCEICGKQCKFDGIYKGYRKRCSYQCMGKSKLNKSHEERKCVICGHKFTIYKIREKRTCSNKCLIELNKSVEINIKRQISLKRTMIEKYGIEHNSKLPDFAIKMKKTKLERYSDENYVNSNKSKQTKLKKYGNENYVNIEKCKKTCLERYGVDNFSKTSEFKLIHFKKMIKKFENIIPLFDINSYNGVSNKKYKFECKECNNVFESSINNGNIPICRICHPIDKEQEQKNILSYVRNILPKNVVISSSDRTIIHPQEIDIYIPSKKLAIEYDGIYWHGEISGNKNKKYHLKKTEECEKKGIHLIHIFENEWLFNQDIIKNKLKHLLGINNDNKIYARNCIIKEIESKEKNQFLDKYHIQGHDKSTIKLGAFYKDELVAVMTFGNSRVALGYSKSNKDEYEMHRFCVNKSVVGIAGKLLSYFIKTYKPKKIISYADRRYSFDNNFYEKLKFKKSGNTEPNYWYFSINDTKKLYHRFNFRKDQLSKKLPKFDPDFSEWQNMQLNGYDRIWDCGHLKYEWIA